MFKCNSTEFNDIKKVNHGKSGEHGKDFMKIKLDSDDNLPFNKILNLHNLTVVIRSVFPDNNKDFPQFFGKECFYML